MYRFAYLTNHGGNVIQLAIRMVAECDVVEVHRGLKRRHDGEAPVSDQSSDSEAYIIEAWTASLKVGSQSKV